MLKIFVILQLLLGFTTSTWSNSSEEEFLKDILKAHIFMGPQSYSFTPHSSWELLEKVAQSHGKVFEPIIQQITDHLCSQTGATSILLLGDGDDLPSHLMANLIQHISQDRRCENLPQYFVEMKSYSLSCPGCSEYDMWNNYQYYTYSPSQKIPVLFYLDSLSQFIKTVFNERIQTEFADHIKNNKFPIISYINRNSYNELYQSKSKDLLQAFKKIIDIDHLNQDHSKLFVKNYLHAKYPLLKISKESFRYFIESLKNYGVFSENLKTLWGVMNSMERFYQNDILPSKDKTLTTSLIDKILQQFWNRPGWMNGHETKDFLETAKESLQQAMNFKEKTIDQTIFSLEEILQQNRNKQGTFSSFYYIGRAQSGKEKFAQQLAKSLSLNFNMFNMEYYQDKKLIKPFKKELLKIIHYNPHGIIYFQNITRAHKHIIRNLVQIMRGRTIHSYENSRVFTRGNIFIFSSHYFVDLENSNENSISQTIKEELKQMISLEFLESVNAYFPFRNFETTHFLEVLKQIYLEEKNRLFEENKWEFAISEETLLYITTLKETKGNISQLKNFLQLLIDIGISEFQMEQRILEKNEIINISQDRIKGELHFTITVNKTEVVNFSLEDYFF